MRFRRAAVRVAPRPMAISHRPAHRRWLRAADWLAPVRVPCNLLRRLPSGEALQHYAR
jgi:hypothetical protein